MSEAMVEEDDRYIVPALDRGLRILALFTADHPVWAPASIAKALDLSRSTVFRLLHTLEARGFIERANEREVQLGPFVLALGHGYTAGRDLVELARPHLERLRDATGASAHLGVLDGPTVTYLARAASRHTVISNIGVGARLPAARTTMGRILLAATDPDTQRAVWQTLEGAPDWPDFAEMLAQDAARGHVATRSAFERGMVSVAAPVRDRDGQVVAAINASAPEAVLPLGIAETTVVPAVCNAATALSAALGYAGSQDSGPVRARPRA
jgi:DNA-binding IclR family transcriptional regulator